MNIAVLTGSPKGAYSITYQTVRYLEKRFPKDSFNALHVGQKIRACEKDMTPYLDALAKADLILFCYPVYTFIVPSQLHRFIELIKESGIDLSGKYAAQISTSLHFYDTTAHAFIRENCSDMGMKYVGGLLADMDDLSKDKGQRDADEFWKLVHFRCEKDIYEPVIPAPKNPVRDYEGSGIVSEKKTGKRAVIVAALEKNDTELEALIKDFINVYPHETRLVNLFEYPFTGGCLGCFNCAAKGKCIYKDGFDDFLRNEIQTNDTIIYAFRIKDHSMGSRMKMYDDRQFCNGHRTVTTGMPMGYLIAGDISKEPNLKMIIDGRGEVGGNFIAGIASNAEGVKKLSDTLEFALDEKLLLPAGFLGVGGMKIFRDLIYVMRGMMKEDHRFYKKHGIYDFPQKQKKRILQMKLVGALISNPRIWEKMKGKMNEGMIMPYKKVIDNATPLE